MELITKLKDFLYSILEPIFETIEPILSFLFEPIFTLFLPFMLIYVIGMVLIQAYAIIRFLIPSKKVTRATYLAFLAGPYIWPYVLLLVIKDWISGKK